MFKQERISALEQLGRYIRKDGALWRAAKRRAIAANAWFTDEYIDHAAQHIAQAYLQPNLLQPWLASYPIPALPKTVGIVMAGNIPLVGFHDFLCAYLSGHKAQLKLSSKDDVLLPHLIAYLAEHHPSITEQITCVERLKDCDAYIATGSNNSARYFNYYFGKKPHIIRKNRTSVALLQGNESEEDLIKLSEDVFSYFGLGCRNVTQLLVPHQYDFAPLLQVFNRYESMMLHHKYKNNYDYHLAIYLLNQVPYQTNGSLLLVENDVPFSAVSVLHYKYYDNLLDTLNSLSENEDIQCVIGREGFPFGSAQRPALSDFADGVDTMKFLCSL